ncbi:unnamed protein product [Rhizoctonia solani]|uniref:DNA replication checkpoint mediator MRC1 domain-containing protein n=1 Tax=Rhizoctonia solani TaxID=456999 RepID=A0A8H3HMS9_9AGAM|nr:unnamed protein product [Rhizoctonia solani]
MPITYGRPRPPNSTQPDDSSAQSTNNAANESSSPTEPDFNQDWKQKLKDIDNDEYDGEVVREPTSSSLTPLVSSSSLSALPESQPQRSSPPKEYRDPETDDPDTSVELNTTVAMPSSDGEPMPGKGDEGDSEDEPVVSKRMTTKHLRVVESDEETDSKQSPSQMSVDRPAKSSNPTTPASSTKKPVKLALSDDSDEEPSKDDKEEQEDIQDASSPQGLSKSEKVEMAKTQQAIAATREIRIPNATRRVDPKSFFANYSSTYTQAEIDSYPFPSGPRSQKLADNKTKLRDKVAALRPLSSAPVPTIKHQASSDPIVGSSQSGPAPITDEDDGPQQKADLFGKPNALGMSMFGAGDSDDEDLPPVNQVLFGTKPKPKPKKIGLEEKKRALAIRKHESDSDDDLEIAGGAQPLKSRILARPGQKPIATQKKQQEVSESQVFRAGHANHFGRDAGPSSSPIKGGGMYEESQFGRPFPAPSSRAQSGWGKLSQPARGNNNGRMSLGQLKQFAATKSFHDGQARQKADEERWTASGGRVLKRDKENGVGVEDAVREALERAEQPQDEAEEEDESDEEYRGSASEQERSEEEDKENLPASGRGRKPHEPVSDFDGSEKGEGDEDKENSLELVGVGSGPSPARIDGASPGLIARSPAQLNGLSPGLSPRIVAPSPSRPFGRSPSHLRLSSSSSGRLPLGELEDEDKVPDENAAVARAPLGELDVHEEEEDEVIRRPMKRPRKGVVEEEDEDMGTPSQRKPGSLSRRLDSPSQRKLPLALSSPSQRLLSSPSQRLRSPSLRFGSPTPRAQRSRLVAGTQSFSQVKTQDMLGGLGDVFGFESQAAPAGSPSQGGGGGLTQLFAASAGPPNAFAALRVDPNNIELTQDERAKLLYKPKISEEEARRDQELFEREDELMAQPFSPTQKEKDSQMWLNEQGLWTQTKPTQIQIVGSQMEEEPSSTPLPTTSLGTPSPSASPLGETSELRRIQRGAPSARESTSEPDPAELPIPSIFDRLMATQRNKGKQKKQKHKSKLGKSDFVEGEAAESDDEYDGFGLRTKDEEDEGDSDEDRHVEGLVDDQVMDEDVEAAAQVQAKFMEQNAQDDEAREKLAREVVTGKHRTRRRRGDNMDLDDDDESEEEHRRGPKNFLKKRKIDNDHLDALAKHDSTRPFVNMYDKAIKSVEDDEFSHLNQITEEVDVVPGTTEEEGSGEDEEEGDEEGEEEEAKEPETPFGHSKKYIPSSEKAEVSFGFKPKLFDHEDESEDEDPATVDLPDAIPQKQIPLVRGNSTNSRIQQWAAQEGSGPRINVGRMGQGVSVTGHTSKNKVVKTKGTSSNRLTALATTSSTSSNRLSRLGSKADGFR